MRQKGQAQIFVLLFIVAIIALLSSKSFGIDFFKDWFGSFKLESPKTSSPILPKPSTIVIPPSPTEKIEEKKTEILPDTTPPKRSNSQPSGTLSADTRKTTIGLATDEKATCRYGMVDGLHYDFMQYTFSETNSISHSALVTALSEGGSYKYYVKCADEKNNKNTDDFIISFSVKKADDAAPPQRSYLEPSGILPAGTKATVINVSTDEPATCRYTTEAGIDFNSMGRSLSADSTRRQHTANISGLENGKVYEYFVRCQDLAGNKNTGDAMIRFSVDTPHGY